MDVAGPPSALIDIWEGASAGALNFSIESDGKIAFDAPQGFRVRVNIIEIGGECIDRIHVAEPFHGGSVASMSDLLLLRAVTVVERGGDGDIVDFRWLLAEVARRGQFPAIDDEELGWLVRAGDLDGETGFDSYRGHPRCAGFVWLFGYKHILKIYLLFTPSPAFPRPLTTPHHTTPTEPLCPPVLHTYLDMRTGRD